MASIVLNGSLASGLGRPELAYDAQSGSAVQTGLPPITSPVVGNTNVAVSVGAQAPLIILGVLVLGVLAFGYWVRPHLK